MIDNASSRGGVNSLNSNLSTTLYSSIYLTDWDGTLASTDELFEPDKDNLIYNIGLSSNNN